VTSFIFSIVFAKLIAFLGTAGLIFKWLKGEQYSVWKKLLILAGIALVLAILSGITFFITFLALGAMIGAMTRTRLTDTDA